MSRNGTGTYNLPAGNPVSTGTTISSSWANSTLSDIASALTGSVASDGQTTPTANLPMGTYAHTGVGNATVRTMYASAGQVQDSTFTYLTSVVGGSAITAVAPIVMTAYQAGQIFRFIATDYSTGATTININSIGIKSIVKVNGSAILDGDITLGSAVQIMYDGTNFQLISNIISENSNTNLGAGSLSSNTGFNNVALGSQALNRNTTGNNNVATGANALSSNTTGNRNIATGLQALYTNTTGSDNVGLGYQALYLNTTGNNNTALGYGTLVRNTTGNSNTAIGSAVLIYNTTGISNTGLGPAALNANTTGSYNTGLGANALSANTTGSGNTSINPTNSSGTYAPVFNPTTENNRLCLGSTAVTNAYVQVAWTVVSDARDKTDFAPVPHGLDFVTKLKPTAYRYKMNREDIEGHGVVRYGFKAQEILELEGDTPVIVDSEDAEKLKINDQSMIAVLVNAIKELNDKFEEYKASHP